MLKAGLLYQEKKKTREKQTTTRRTMIYKLKSLRRETTANFISESTCKSKAAWGFINSEKKPRRQETPDIEYIMLLDTQRVYDRVELANVFHSNFASIADDALKNIQTEKPNVFLSEALEIAFHLQN